MLGPILMSLNTINIFRLNIYSQNLKFKYKISKKYYKLNRGQYVGPISSEILRRIKMNNNFI